MHDNNVSVIVQKNVIDNSVEQLTKNLEHYLSEVMGLSVKARLRDSAALPFFFTRLYTLYQLDIGSTSFTAVFLKQEDEFKPAQFIKHLQQVQWVEMDELCVVAQSLPTYVRKRLIEKGIPFVIPHVQMYLPAMGMEWRARAVRRKPVTVERFSPATQVVLIYWLLGRIEGSMTPLELSKQLWYSTMTMSRALNELESSNIARVERVGRERFVTFSENRKVTWQEVYPRLRTPVIQLVRVARHALSAENGLPAGLTALSHRSMLSEPAYPEYALSRDAWKAMEKAGIEKIPLEEEGTCVLQVWCYDPKILAVDGQVDPFSLFLSLQDENDERIEMALDEMMAPYL